MQNSEGHDEEDDSWLLATQLQSQGSWLTQVDAVAAPAAGLATPAAATSTRDAGSQMDTVPVAGTGNARLTASDMPTPAKSLSFGAGEGERLSGSKRPRSASSDAAAEAVAAALHAPARPFTSPAAAAAVTPAPQASPPASGSSSAAAVRPPAAAAVTTAPKQVRFNMTEEASDDEDNDVGSGAGPSYSLADMLGSSSSVSPLNALSGAGSSSTSSSGDASPLWPLPSFFSFAPSPGGATTSSSSSSSFSPVVSSSSGSADDIPSVYYADTLADAVASAIPDPAQRDALLELARNLLAPTAAVTHGLVLKGPHASGKTWAVRALAASAFAPIAWVDPLVGPTLESPRALYEAILVATADAVFDYLARHIMLARAATEIAALFDDPAAAAAALKSAPPPPTAFNGGAVSPPPGAPAYTHAWRSTHASGLRAAVAASYATAKPEDLALLVFRALLAPQSEEARYFEGSTSSGSSSGGVGCGVGLGSTRQGHSPTALGFPLARALACWCSFGAGAVETVDRCRLAFITVMVERWGWHAVAQRLNFEEQREVLVRAGGVLVSEEATPDLFADTQAPSASSSVASVPPPQQPQQPAKKGGARGKGKPAAAASADDGAAAAAAVVPPSSSSSVATPPPLGRPTMDAFVPRFPFDKQRVVGNVLQQTRADALHLLKADLCDLCTLCVGHVRAAHRRAFPSQAGRYRPAAVETAAALSGGGGSGASRGAAAAPLPASVAVAAAAAEAPLPPPPAHLLDALAYYGLPAELPNDALLLPRLVIDTAEKVSALKEGKRKEVYDSVMTVLGGAETSARGVEDIPHFLETGVKRQRYLMCHWPVTLLISTSAGGALERLPGLSRPPVALGWRGACRAASEALLKALPEPACASPYMFARFLGLLVSALGPVVCFNGRMLQEAAAALWPVFIAPEVIARRQAMLRLRAQALGGEGAAGSTARRGGGAASSSSSTAPLALPDAPAWLLAPAPPPPGWKELCAAAAPALEFYRERLYFMQVAELPGLTASNRSFLAGLLAPPGAPVPALPPVRSTRRGAAAARAAAAAALFPPGCTPEEEQAIVEGLATLRDVVAAAKALPVTAIPSSALAPRTLASDLKYYPKLLLCAAFCAAFNPPETDARYFSPEKTGKRSLRAEKSRSSAALAKSRMLVTGPKAFALGRLRAIFDGLVLSHGSLAGSSSSGGAASGGGGGASGPSSLVLAQGDLARIGQPEFQDMINALVWRNQLKPLETSAWEPDTRRYSCLISSDVAVEVAASVGLDIAKYLHDPVI